MSNLLYYPYINIANSNWFSKSILYWDEIFTIVPDSFSWEPEKLMPFTQDLIKKGLVVQAFPSNYNVDFDKLKEVMLGIIDSNAFDIDTKRINLKDGKYDYIHKDKFAYKIIEELVVKNLATKEEGSDWYFVELDTTRIIMWLLASAMGGQGNMKPSTDQDYYFSNKFYENFQGYTIQKVRDFFIDELLPFPLNPDYEKLKKFKEKNYDKLIKFRNEVESIINLASAIEDSETRISKCNEVSDKLISEKEELIAKLEESKTGKVLKSMVTGAIITAGSMLYFDTIRPLISGSIGAAIAGTKAYLKNPIEGNNLEYIALLDKVSKTTMRN